MIEKTLYAVLSQLEISLFPVAIPQEQELPAVTYARLNTKPTNTLRGTNLSNDNASFRIDIRAGDYMVSVDTGELIINKMGIAFGSGSLLLEKRDADDSEPGDYHRELFFSLREIITTRESS